MTSNLNIPKISGYYFSSSYKEEVGASFKEKGMRSTFKLARCLSLAIFGFIGQVGLLNKTQPLSFLALPMPSPSDDSNKTCSIASLEQFRGYLLLAPPITSAKELVEYPFLAPPPYASQPPGLNHPWTVDDHQVPLTHEAKKTNKQIRKEYNAARDQKWCETYKQRFKEVHDHGKLIQEPLAREVSVDRDDDKERHQEESSNFFKWVVRPLRQCVIHPFLKTGIIAAIRRIYECATFQGINPKYDYFINYEGKTPEQVAYSAFKTDGKDLGLEGNAVGKQVHIWQKLTPRIYPEYMNEAFTECMWEASWETMNETQKMKKIDACVDKLYDEPSEV